LSNAASLNCNSQDSICLNVKRQTKCGVYQHFATKAATASRTLGMFFRPEIYWKSSERKQGRREGMLKVVDD
jgi:hypothetical protein